MQKKGNSIKNLLIAFALYAFTMICSYVFQELHFLYLTLNGTTTSYPLVLPLGMLSVFVFLKKQLQCTDKTKYLFRLCIKVAMFVIGIAAFCSGGLIILEVLLAFS